MGFSKGSLISEGILTLVPLPTKGAKSLPRADCLNLPPFTVNNLFKFSAQGRKLAPFFGNGTKVKIPSKNLANFKADFFYWHFLSSCWVLSRSSGKKIGAWNKFGFNKSLTYLLNQWLDHFLEIQFVPNDFHILGNLVLNQSKVCTKTIKHQNVMGFRLLVVS